MKQIVVIVSDGWVDNLLVDGRLIDDAFPGTEVVVVDIDDPSPYARAAMSGENRVAFIAARVLADA